MHRQSHTCGICHSDIHMIDNDWAISKYPLFRDMKLLGSFVAQVLCHLKVGDRVGVGWQSEPAWNRKDCLRGNETPAVPNKATIVDDMVVGFGSHIQIDSLFVLKFQMNLSLQLLLLLCVGITVYSALQCRNDFRAKKNIGIIGIGGSVICCSVCGKLVNRVTVFTTIRIRKVCA